MFCVACCSKVWEVELELLFEGHGHWRLAQPGAQAGIHRLYSLLVLSTSATPLAAA